jgi:hypothetical protein
VLKLLAALGPAAGEFVIAGAQAIKFSVENARGTKDVDFILNVMALRTEPLQLDAVLKRLGYGAVAGARNFQFEKPLLTRCCPLIRAATRKFCTRYSRGRPG